MKSEIDIDSGHNIHNNLFIKTFSDPENVKVFLKMALPESITSTIDFSEIKIDFTTYISDEIKDYSSDIVVKTLIKTGENQTLLLDIYILLEHKTEAKKKSLVQVLKYLYFEWQKDVDNKRPLRVIIPLIFYHGEGPWNVPRSFVDQFNVIDEIKEFLLNYRYILFDTKDWDFLAENNQDLKDNVFLLTSLVLMKSAYNDDMETVKAIFKLWNEKGFTKNKEMMIFFLTYVSYIRDIPLDQLKKTLEECNIEGGDIMPRLAQRLMDEGKDKWKKEGIKEGKKEEKIETAKRMLLNNFTVEQVVTITGLTEKEVKELMS